MRTRSGPQTRSQSPPPKTNHRPHPEPVEFEMGGVYVWGEDDFACYVGKFSTHVGGTKNTGGERHGKRIPWRKLSEEEQKKIVWKRRRCAPLNKSEKVLLQKYEKWRRTPAEELPGTVAETPPHYWVEFECADSRLAGQKKKYWEKLEKQEIRKRKNAVNHIRYNGRSRINRYFRDFHTHELQLWPLNVGYK